MSYFPKTVNLFWVFRNRFPTNTFSLVHFVYYYYVFPGTMQPIWPFHRRKNIIHKDLFSMMNICCSAVDLGRTNATILSCQYNFPKLFLILCLSKNSSVYLTMPFKGLSKTSSYCLTS